MSIENIMKLAIPVDEELLNFGVEDHSPEIASLAAALKEQQEVEKKSSAVNAAREIMAMLKLSDTAVANGVKCLREIRQAEKEQLKALQEVARAKAYGLKTNNFLPLARLLGQVKVIPGHTENSALYFVPADFQLPKQKAKKAVAAK